MQIIVGDFCRRNLQSHKGSEFTGGEAELISVVTTAFTSNQRPGYRSGVLLVTVPPDGFLAGVKTLLEGERYEMRFEARRPGEAPRKMAFARLEKQPAKSVDVVVYHSSVLAEDPESHPEAPLEGEGYWEIVTILASPEENDHDAPMPVDTLLANHFVASGGTSTKMDPAKFEAAIKRSYEYWRDKVTVA